jgi:hypothetical protein
VPDLRGGHLLLAGLPVNTAKLTTELPSSGRQRVQGALHPVAVTRVLRGNTWFLLVLIVALGAILRIWHMGAQNLWNDEWFSLDDAAHIADLDRHRPLFYLILHYWTRVL